MHAFKQTGGAVVDRRLAPAGLTRLLGELRHAPGARAHLGGGARAVSAGTARGAEYSNRGQSDGTAWRSGY
jgi:hypothetical protein